MSQAEWNDALRCIASEAKSERSHGLESIEKLPKNISDPALLISIIKSLVDLASKENLDAVRYKGGVAAERRRDAALSLLTDVCATEAHTIPKAALISLVDTFLGASSTIAFGVLKSLRAVFRVHNNLLNLTKAQWSRLEAQCRNLVHATDPKSDPSGKNVELALNVLLLLYDTDLALIRPQVMGLLDELRSVSSFSWPSRISDHVVALAACIFVRTDTASFCVQADLLHFFLDLAVTKIVDSIPSCRDTSLSLAIAVIRALRFRADNLHAHFPPPDSLSAESISELANLTSQSASETRLHAPRSSQQLSFRLSFRDNLPYRVPAQTRPSFNELSFIDSPSPDVSISPLILSPAPSSVSSKSDSLPYVHTLVHNAPSYPLHALHLFSQSCGHSQNDRVAFHNGFHGACLGRRTLAFCPAALDHTSLDAVFFWDLVGELLCLETALSSPTAAVASLMKSNLDPVGKTTALLAALERGLVLDADHQCILARFMHSHASSSLSLPLKKVTLLAFASLDLDISFLTESLTTDLSRFAAHALSRHKIDSGEAIAIFKANILPPSDAAFHLARSVLTQAAHDAQWPRLLDAVRSWFINVTKAYANVVIWSHRAHECFYELRGFTALYIFLIAGDNMSSVPKFTGPCPSSPSLFANLLIHDALVYLGNETTRARLSPHMACDDTPFSSTDWSFPHVSLPSPLPAHLPTVNALYSLTRALLIHDNIDHLSAYIESIFFGLMWLQASVSILPSAAFIGPWRALLAHHTTRIPELIPIHAVALEDDAINVFWADARIQKYYHITTLAQHTLVSLEAQMLFYDDLCLSTTLGGDFSKASREFTFRSCSSELIPPLFADYLLELTCTLREAIPDTRSLYDARISAQCLLVCAFLQRGVPTRFTDKLCEMKDRALEKKSTPSEIDRLLSLVADAVSVARVSQISTDLILDIFGNVLLREYRSARSVMTPLLALNYISKNSVCVTCLLDCSDNIMKKRLEKLFSWYYTSVVNGFFIYGPIRAMFVSYLNFPGAPVSLERSIALCDQLMSDIDLRVAFAAADVRPAVADIIEPQAAEGLRCAPFLLLYNRLAKYTLLVKWATLHPRFRSIVKCFVSKQEFFTHASELAWESYEYLATGADLADHPDAPLYIHEHIGGILMHRSSSSYNEWLHNAAPSSANPHLAFIALELLSCLERQGSSQSRVRSVQVKSFFETANYLSVFDANPSQFIATLLYLVRLDINAEHTSGSFFRHWPLTMPHVPVPALSLEAFHSLLKLLFKLMQSRSIEITTGSEKHLKSEPQGAQSQTPEFTSDNASLAVTSILLAAKSQGALPEVMALFFWLFKMPDWPISALLVTIKVFISFKSSVAYEVIFWCLDIATKRNGHTRLSAHSYQWALLTLKLQLMHTHKHHTELHNILEQSHESILQYVLSSGPDMPLHPAQLVEILVWPTGRSSDTSTAAEALILSRTPDTIHKALEFDSPYADKLSLCRLNSKLVEYDFIRPSVFYGHLLLSSGDLASVNGVESFLKLAGASSDFSVEPPMARANRIVRILSFSDSKKLPEAISVASFAFAVKSLLDLIDHPGYSTVLTIASQVFAEFQRENMPYLLDLSKQPDPSHVLPLMCISSAALDSSLSKLNMADEAVLPECPPDTVLESAAHDPDGFFFWLQSWLLPHTRLSRSLASFLSSVEETQVSVGKEQSSVLASISPVLSPLLFLDIVTGPNRNDALSLIERLLRMRKQIHRRVALALIESVIVCQHYVSSLAVDWLALSWLAHVHGSCAAALYFLEKHHKVSSMNIDAPSSSIDVTRLTLAIYETLPDTDGGVLERIDTGEDTSVSRIFARESQWAYLFMHEAALFENGLPAPDLPFSMFQTGLPSLSRALALSSPRSQEDLFNDAWIMGDWTLPTESESIYANVVYAGQTFVAHSESRDAQPSLSLRSCALVAPLVKQLSQHLSNQNEVLVAKSTGNIVATQAAFSVSQRSSVPAHLASTDLSHSTQIKSSSETLVLSLIGRARALELASAKESELFSQETLPLLYQASDAYRVLGATQQAANMYMNAQKLCRERNMDIPERGKVSLASMLWDTGHAQTAIRILENLKEGNFTAMFRLAQWYGEAKLKTSDSVADEYHARAIAMAPDSESKASAHLALGEFADAHAQLQYNEYDRAKKQHQLFRRQKEAQIRDIQGILTSTRRRSMLSPAEVTALQKALNEHQYALRDDFNKVDGLRDVYKKMVRTAVLNLAKTIEYECRDRYAGAVIKFCNLWLSSAHEGFNEDLVSFFATVSTSKFVPLVHQLVARLTMPSSHKTGGKGDHKMFQVNLTTLVKRLALDHPFHTWYHLNAIALDAYDIPTSYEALTLSRANTQGSSKHHAAQSKRPLKRQKVNSADMLPSSSNTRLNWPPSAGDADRTLDFSLSSDLSIPRYDIARAFILLVRKEATPRHLGFFDDIQILCEALAEFASFNLQSVQRWTSTNGTYIAKQREIPEMLLLRTISGLSIPIPTRNLPVDETCRYSDIVSLKAYVPAFNTAGGLNLPKIITCVASDGRTHKQLVKGNDDPRQDAVMEQCFEMINMLLAQDHTTNKRHLFFPTYKVLPLTSQSGVLQFVDNTTSLKDYLETGYRQIMPQVMPSLNASKSTLHKYEPPHNKSPDAPRSKIQAFYDILGAIPPVMGSLLLGKVPNPEAWISFRYEMTRSLATTSIVGHILGLGDRHPSNILVNTHVGYLVPIDLGIAFDAGKTLRIPERVPFRLTQNLVDALGIHGTEGPFKTYCIHVMQVLRRQASVIMTVLQVFKHDPLYKWAVSKEILARVSNEAADDDNLDADRMLRTVQEKLQNGLSVEYTVNDLISRATSKSDLALMFCGWQAYL